MGGGGLPSTRTTLFEQVTRRGAATLLAGLLSGAAPGEGL
jgi:hypothetical protein